MHYRPVLFSSWVAVTDSSFIQSRKIRTHIAEEIVAGLTEIM